MTNSPLSPTQIKSIASAIRGLEVARLGKQLPNTTALNAITRALGLGQDFRTYAATYAPQTTPVKVSDKLRISSIIFAFKALVGDEALDLPVQNRIEEELDQTSWIVDICEGAHGFATLYIWTEASDISPSDLEQVRNRVSNILIGFEKDGYAYPIAHTMAWQSFGDPFMLGVDFEYDETGQICTSSVEKSDWEARKSTDLSDEEAMLLLYGDIEIEPEYDANDITVHDVILDRTLYQEY